MDEGATADVFLFEAFRLDRRAGTLFRRDDKGAAVPVAIGSRGLAVLSILVARHGDLVSKDEIMQAVWPGTVVEDNNLTVQISALRRVIDQGRAGGSCIQTIPGRGYRFAAPLTRVDADARSATQTISHDGGRSRPRLSIVVLPFANLSNDPEQQYFADGITEDLTTDLSRIANLFVISRNSAFTYRDKPIDTKLIGRELGVRYALEGSVRRSATRVRVSAQLIDAETDAHLWAERFDGDTADLFALQDEVTSRIANTLGVELIAREAIRPTDNPDALDYVLRGRAARLRPNSRQVYAEAISLFEHALELDPQSVEAQTGLARSLVSRVIDLMTDSAAADLARADQLIGRVLAASPRSADAHFTKGQLLRARGRHPEAILEYERVLAITPNAQEVLHALGWCKLSTGSIEEVIPLEEQAIRLSPRDSHIGFRYARIGLVHLLQSRVEEAIRWLERAISSEPEYASAHAWLASAYALRGETERAATELAAARRLDGDDIYSSFARLKIFGALWSFGVPKVRALCEANYFPGLRGAGMPEK